MAIPDVESQRNASSPDELLNRARSDGNGNVNIPADVFEQMYLAPKTAVAGHLRQTFANPTAICKSAFGIRRNTADKM